MRHYFVLNLMLFITACAFKPPVERAPVQQEAPVATSEDGHAYVSWNEEGKIKRKLTLKDGVYSFSTPVTLPAVVPDQIGLELSQHSHIATPQVGNCVAHASLSGNEEKSLALPITELVQPALRDGANYFSMKVSGIRNLLSDAMETSSVVTVDCFDLNTQRLIRVIFRLATPPSKIQFNHQRSQDLVRDQIPAIDSLSKLDAPQMQYSLYDVIQVSNNGDESVQLSLPAIIPARLWSRFTENRWEPTSACSGEHRLHTEDLDYATEAHLFLMSEDLPEKFLTYGDRIELTLPAGGRLLLGVYLKGEKARSLKAGNVPPVLQQVTQDIVQRCDYSCGKATEDHILLYLNVWGCRQLGEPNCDGPKSCYSCWRSDRMCQVCYRFDISQNWDWPKKYCNAWHITPITAQVKTYKQRSAIILDYDLTSAVAQIRSAFAPPQDDPSAREAVFLNTQSKHWD